MRARFFMVFLFLLLPAAAMAQEPPQEPPMHDAIQALRDKANKKDDGFKFENIKSLDDMEAFLKENFPIGTDRDKLRDIFMKQGRATGFPHPRAAGVEKYIYDINLCYYYVFRWNISADYDGDNKLQRLYLNGREVYGAKDPIVENALKDTVGQSIQQQILKVQKPRPEAYKGETALSALVYDRDGDLGTIDDQKLIGAAPDRADPNDMGKLIMYTDVLPWRSIFDHDHAQLIVNATHDCAVADMKYGQKEWTK